MQIVFFSTEKWKLANKIQKRENIAPKWFYSTFSNPLCSCCRIDAALPFHPTLFFVLFCHCHCHCYCHCYWYWIWATYYKVKPKNPSLSSEFTLTCFHRTMCSSGKKEGEREPESHRTFEHLYYFICLHITSHHIFTKMMEFAS